MADEDQELVRISAADLNGTTWTLLELSDDQPALADTEVTISFQEGQISGFGGCNSYTSSFSFLVFIALLLLASEIGFRLGHSQQARMGEDARSQITTMQGAILALLGLLLAFTFSMAVSRYELRKTLVVLVTIDLDRPRRGPITVGQQSMLDLQESLRQPVPWDEP